MMQHNSHRNSVAVVVLALVGMLMAACSGPMPANAVGAASVNDTTISMSQFQQLTRLVIGVNRVNDATIPTWQLSAGKTNQITAEKQVLNLLMSNLVLDNVIRKNAKLYQINLADLKTQEDTQLNQLFAQVPPQFKPLVDQGILTPDGYRPFVHNQLIEKTLSQSPNFTFDTAHIRILTVKSKKQADALLAQLNGGSVWSTLAIKDSTDLAQSSGGEIASLVPHFLPAEIDRVVFAPKNPPTDIQEVHSRLGWSLVQVVSRAQNQPWSMLDTSAPLVPTIQMTAAAAAIFGYINNLVNQGHPDVNVNWCGNSNGQDCPAIFPTDQVQ